MNGDYNIQLMCTVTKVMSHTLTLRNIPCNSHTVLYFPMWPHRTLTGLLVYSMCRSVGDCKVLQCTQPISEETYCRKHYSLWTSVMHAENGWKAFPTSYSNGRLNDVMKGPKVLDSSTFHISWTIWLRKHFTPVHTVHGSNFAMIMF